MRRPFNGYLIRYERSFVDFLALQSTPSSRGTSRHCTKVRRCGATDFCPNKNQRICHQSLILLHQHTSHYGSLLSGCFFAKIDLKDAYYSIPIHPSQRQFFGFCWQRRWGHFNVMPMGLRNSPYYWTVVMNSVARYVWRRTFSWRFDFILDDWLVNHRRVLPVVQERYALV